MASKSSKRFYLSRYKYALDRPPYFEDLGSHLTQSGVVFQGLGSTLILMSPGLEFPLKEIVLNRIPPFTVAYPTLEEWGEIIRQTDNPEIFVGEIGGINKVFHRRQRYIISGEVQQQIWAKDSFCCRYCGRKMGNILLTIDHFVPLEMGGVNDESNYITACRKCNKDKGMLMPEVFCQQKGLDYEGLKHYLEINR